MVTTELLEKFKKYEVSDNMFCTERQYADNIKISMFTAQLCIPSKKGTEPVNIIADKDMHSKLEISDIGNKNKSSFYLDSCNHLATYSCIRIKYNITEKREAVLIKWIKLLNDAGFDNIELNVKKKIVNYVPKLEWCVFYIQKGVSSKHINNSSYATLATFGFLRLVFLSHEEEKNIIDTILEVRDTTRLKAFKALMIGYMKTQYFWEGSSASWLPLGTKGSIIYLPSVWEKEDIDKMHSEKNIKFLLDNAIVLGLNKSFSAKNINQFFDKDYLKKNKNTRVIYNERFNIKFNGETNIFSSLLNTVKKLLADKKYLTLIKFLESPDLYFKNDSEITLFLKEDNKKEVKVKLESVILSNGLSSSIQVKNNKKLDLNKYESFSERYFSRL